MTHAAASVGAGYGVVPTTLVARRLRGRGDRRRIERMLPEVLAG